MFLLSFGQFETDIRKLYEQAEILFQKGDYEEAIELYKKIEKSYGNYLNTYSRIVESYIYLGQFSDAKSENKKRFKKEKEVAYHFYNALISYKQQKRKEFDLSAVIGRLYTLDDLEWVFYKLTEMNLYEEAIEFLKKAKEKMPESFPYNLYLARALIKKGKIEEGVRIYADLLKIDGYLETIQNELLENELHDTKTPQGQKAEKIFLEYSQKNPSVVNYYKILYWMYFNSADMEKAYLYAKTIDKLEKQNGLFLYSFANECKNLSEIEYAIQSLNVVLQNYGKSSPVYLQSLFLLITILQEKHKDSKQRELLEYIDSLYNILLTTPTLPQQHTIIKLNYLEFLCFIGNFSKAKSILQETNWDYLTADQLGKKRIYESLIKMIEDDLDEAFISFLSIENGNYGQDVKDMASFFSAICQIKRGDINWAKAKLRVLKEATSRLIANDALLTFMQIEDVLDEDTSLAELLFHIGSRNFPKAFHFLEKYTYNLPVINFFKGYLFYEMGQMDSAAYYFANLVPIYDSPYNDEVLYYLWKIHKYRNNQEKADEYLILLLKYHKDSIYTEIVRRKSSLSKTKAEDGT